MLIAEREATEGKESEIFTDISQMQPSDQDGPASYQSPYFDGGKSSGYKRKRGGARSGGGGRKPAKSGQWYSKRGSQASGSKSGATSRKKAASPKKQAATGIYTTKAVGLLAPPRAKTVNNY